MSANNLSSPRTLLAMSLLGLSDDPQSFIHQSEPRLTSHFIEKKREILKTQLEALRNTITEKDLQKYSTVMGNVFTENLHAPEFIGIEKTRTLGIVQRDRQRVRAFKEQMKSEIKAAVELEILKKKESQDKELREKSFADKLDALQQSRDAGRLKRQQERDRKYQAKQVSLKAAEREAEELRQNLSSRISQNLERVDAKKKSIKEKLRIKAIEYNHKLLEVKTRLECIERAESEQADEFYWRVQNRLKKSALVRANLLESWRARGITRGQILERRINAESEILSRKQKRRPSVESLEIIKEQENRNSRIAENKKKIRNEIGERMKRARERTERIISNARRMRQEFADERRDEFESKSKSDRSQVKREKLAERMNKLSMRRNSMGKLVRYNVQRQERIAQLEAKRRISIIRETNARVEQLKNVENVRREKQKLLRRNWIEKDNIMRVISKLKRVNNDANFSSLI